jgi:hypothetical protein
LLLVIKHLFLNTCSKWIWKTCWQGIVVNVN